MPKPQVELKYVMISCHKCGWSYSTRKEECPMCGAQISIQKKDYVRILMEYVERQGVNASKKECESYIKKFKKKNKKTPSLDDLWKGSIDYVEASTSNLKSGDEKEAKKKKELELKNQMENIKKKNKEGQKKEKSAQISRSSKVSTIFTDKKATIPSDKEKRLKELEQKRKKQELTEKASEKSKAKEKNDFIICPSCGKKNPIGSRFCLEDGKPLNS